MQARLGLRSLLPGRGFSRARCRGACDDRCRRATPLVGSGDDRRGRDRRRSRPCWRRGSMPRRSRCGAARPAASMPASAPALVAGAGIGAGVTAVDAGRAAATGGAAPGPVVVVVMVVVDGMRCRALQALEIAQVLVQLGDARGLGLALPLARQAILGAARRRRRRRAALAQCELVRSGSSRLLLVIDRCRDTTTGLATVRLGHRRRALSRRRETLAIGAEISALRRDRLARLALRDGLRGLGRRHGENHACLEAVHVVAAEGARIAAEERREHLVERARPRRCVRACDLRQRNRPSAPGIRRPTSLRMHLPMRARGSPVPLRRGPWIRRQRYVPRPCARALRRRAASRISRAEGGRPAARRQRRRRGRCGRDHRRGRGARAEASRRRDRRRRIEQQRVFANQPGRSPTRSRGCRQRRRTAPGRPRSLSEADGQAPVSSAPRPGARARQHRVVVDVGGAIALGRRDADAQARLLFGSEAGDFDLGVEDFAEQDRLRLLRRPRPRGRDAREDARQRVAAARLVSAKRPENFSFLFKASPGMSMRTRRRVRRNGSDSPSRRCFCASAPDPPVDLDPAPRSWLRQLQSSSW